jgi:hypothetical protein
MVNRLHISSQLNIDCIVNLNSVCCIKYSGHTDVMLLDD